MNPKKEEQPNVEEEPVVEEAKENVAEEVPQEENQEKQNEENIERKKKTENEEEIAPGELLERPEGALSLAEYREQLKEKNKNISGGNKAQTLNVNLPSDLKVLEKEKIQVKEKRAPKARKVDNSVQQININFKTEDNTNTRFQKPQYQQNKKPTKAKINIDDLPSL